ncbi:MAG: DMT family transporter [Caldilineaceae bacterium]|nr:DMT family transporter [Caldilineaceae bacterium]
MPYVILLGFFYGSSLVASRFSVGQYDPRTYIALRLLLASAAHLVIYGLMRRRLPGSGQLWRYAAVLGIVGTAISMTSIVTSLKYQSSGVTSLLLTLNPAVTILLAQIFLPDELLTPRKALGVTVALSGAGLLFLRGGTGLADFGRADWRGYAWAILGVLCSAGGSVFARRCMRQMDAWDVASVRMFTAALALLPVAWLGDGFDLSQVTWVGYAALFYAALIGTFGGMWLNFYIIKNYGATPASQTAYVIPLVTTVLGAALLGETVTSGMLAGMAVIFVGISLLNFRPRFPRSYFR